MMFDDLSDDELYARLVQCGVDPDKAGLLVHDRAQPTWARAISEILEDL